MFSRWQTIALKAIFQLQKFDSRSFEELPSLNAELASKSNHSLNLNFTKTLWNLSFKLTGVTDIGLFNKRNM